MACALKFFNWMNESSYIGNTRGFLSRRSLVQGSSIAKKMAVDKTVDERGRVFSRFYPRTAGTDTNLEYEPVT